MKCANDLEDSSVRKLKSVATFCRLSRSKIPSDIFVQVKGAVIYPFSLLYTDNDSVIEIRVVNGSRYGCYTNSQGN